MRAGWIEVNPREAEVLVQRSEDRADAVVHLELRNLIDRAVRVDEVRIVYREGDRLIRTDRPGESFFAGSFYEWPRKIERGRRLEWVGVCLDSPPVEADLVRLEIDLSHRSGLGRERAMEGVDVRLRHAPEPRLLKLPFEGYWIVTQGHSCRTYHRLGGFGGDFAWDFLRLGPGGRPGKDPYEASRRNADSATFGQAVLAPANGRVVRVASEVPDNDALTDYPNRGLLRELGRPDWIFGNFVVLDLGDGAYVLLGHLQQGSVTVRPGDPIAAGTPIARCGNSGNTFRPHLHLQVMDRPDPTDPGVRGLPARFLDYREIDVAGGENRKDILVRRVARGDPPENSIVTLSEPEALR